MLYQCHVMNGWVFGTYKRPVAKGKGYHKMEQEAKQKKIKGLIGG